MSIISDCQSSLVAKAQEQGYLTFDDILDVSDTFNLSVSEVDVLSEAIQLLGILVYESAPEKKISENEEAEDYSRTDYEAIYQEVVRFSENLKPLINEIKQYPTPQYGEIDILARQIATGNTFARERLITIYMRTALKIALSMTKQFQLDVEEAVAASFIGLCTAVDRYNPDGFSAFHSYASLWIQQNIQRECTPVWMDFYFPAYYKDKMLKVLQKYKEYCDDWPLCELDESIVSKIADELEMLDEEVRNYLTASIQQIFGKVSLEEYTEGLENGTDNTPREIVDDSFFDIIAEKSLRQEMKIVIRSLSEREAQVIKMRNGIGYSRPMTLEEVGAEFNVTRERIRQIEAKAIIKLRHPSRSKLLKDYLD